MVSYILFTEREKSVRLQQSYIEDEERIIGNYLFDKGEILDDKGKEREENRPRQ